MPTVHREGPFRFFFYSNEGSEPSHIHIEAGDSVAKFWLEPITFESSTGFRAHDLSDIRRIIEDNQAEFVRRWNEFFRIEEADREGD